MRSSQYISYKQRWATESLHVLYKLFPKLAEMEKQGNVEVSADVSTPLSIKHYLFKSRGQVHMLLLLLHIFEIFNCVNRLLVLIALQRGILMSELQTS